MGAKLLVPFDGSSPATEALQYAFETFPDPEVTVLYVVSTPEGYWTAFEHDPTDLPGYDEAESRGQGVLQEAESVADDLGEAVTTELTHGVPADRIVARAEDADVDTIVIGSHGREGVSRILLGSVAETVVRRAPTPVLVVR